MARTGRPRIPEQNRLDDRVDVRVSKAEKKLIAEIAGPNNLSAWSRELLLRAARREQKRREASRSPAAPEEGA